MVERKFVVSCEFVLSYEGGKWVVEQDYPEVRVESDDYETALRLAMEEWIKFLKETNIGKRWIEIMKRGYL